MDNIMNEPELDTDEEDLIIEEVTINNLKNNFTFNIKRLDDNHFKSIIKYFRFLKYL